jgi:hypothetical protein
LNTFKEYVIDRDLPNALNGKASYLAALGLSTYTEVLGGFYSGDLSKNLKQHYTCFINEFFPVEYAEINNKLEGDNLNGLYGTIRCGLTHEYFIKKRSRVEIDDSEFIPCGIMYDPESNPQIVLYVNKYFRDFANAFERYYDRVFSDQSVLKKLDLALMSINSSIRDLLDNPEFSSMTSGSYDSKVIHQSNHNDTSIKGD